MSEQEARKWREYDMVAEFVARRGTSSIRLPENVAADVAAEIDADTEAFVRRVRETRYALARDGKL